MNDQLALCNTTAWSILGTGRHVSGLFQYFPLPEVSCPVLDVRDCDPTVVLLICQRHHPSPDLIVDVDGLISALLTIGARLISLPSISPDAPSVRQPDQVDTPPLADLCFSGRNELVQLRRQP